MRSPTIAERDDDVLDLRLGDRLVASYHYGAELARPHLAPLLDAAGRAVTAEPGPPDHPHHRGVWVGHRDVAGVDHWTEFAGHGRIVHRSFAFEDGAVIEELDWLDGTGRAALREQRVIRLHPGPALDLTVALTAPAALTLGANKDASLAAVRVAPSMTTIENSAGGRGESACWGRRAAWCDVSDATRGLAVLDHPENPRSPTPWHVRAYGLVAPNPFLREPMALADGETVTFRYRFIVHDARARIAEHHREFALEG